MKLRLLFLSIFLFVSQDFIGMSFSSRLLNKIKTSNLYKYINKRRKFSTNPSLLKLRRTGKKTKTQLSSAKTKKGYFTGGVGILGTLYAALWAKESSFAQAEGKSADKEEIKKAALKNWQKEIKNPDAFDGKELPEDIKEILDEHYKKIESEIDLKLGKPKPKIFYFLPDYFIKKDREDYSRIDGAKSMSAVINENNLTELFVPKKYSYVAPNGRHYVICKIVKQNKVPITTEELKQLIFLAKKIGWLDGHQDNFLKTDQGIALIDTESYYMDPELLRHYTTVYDLGKEQWFKIKNILLPGPSKKVYLKTKFSIVDKMSHAFLTKDAKKYLEEREEYYKKKIITHSYKGLNKKETEKILENQHQENQRIENLLTNLALQYINFQ